MAFWVIVSAATFGALNAALRMLFDAQPNRLCSRVVSVQGRAAVVIAHPRKGSRRRCVLLEVGRRTEFTSRTMFEAVHAARAMVRRR